MTNAGNKLIVVYFTATWCGPCKVIDPTLEKLAIKYKSDVVTIKVVYKKNKCKFWLLTVLILLFLFQIDVDDEDTVKLVSRFAASTMPTFVFLKRAKLLESFSGAIRTKVEQTIQTHLH